MVKNSDEEVILSQSEQVNVQISEADKTEVPDKSSCKQNKTELNGNVANEPKIFIRCNYLFIFLFYKWGKLNDHR